MKAFIRGLSATIFVVITYLSDLNYLLPFSLVMYLVGCTTVALYAFIAFAIYLGLGILSIIGIILSEEG